MEEIKIGEYVRTKKGQICKVLGIREEQRNGNRIYGHKAYYLDNHKGSLTPAFILKHSSNIIDLIEEGDYVNGKKIETIIEGNWKSEGVAEKILCFEIDFPIEKGLRAYHNCDIKSIVTKEQFANIEYRIG